MKTLILSGLFLCATVISCKQPTKSSYTLGTVTFDVTGTDAAQQAFLKGHLLMHSFEFADAAEAFREAQTLDPTCAMAYWGEAMTYNHAIWQEQDYEKAVTTLKKLGATPEARVAKGATPLEKDFLQAVNVLYGEGTKTERDRAYAKFMGELYNKYAGNHEVASLYALALLGEEPVGRNGELYGESARISAQILKENPNHPGALHYFIHANDDPGHAREALHAADEYSVVAHDAAHALHMPTHIYLALGMWDRVVSSNEVSWQASVNRKQKKNLPNDALGYHSFHWLEYGYLQQGRLQDAQKLLQDMMTYCAALPSVKARTHEIFLKSSYAVETNDWKSSLIAHETDAKGLNVATQGLESFVRGMRAYAMADIPAMEKVIATMEQDRIRETAKIDGDGIALCGSGGASRENTTKTDIDLLQLMEMELQGMKAWQQKDLATAGRLLKEAASFEDRIAFGYGPPVAKPSSELYGEFLLSQNQPREAMQYFDTSLKRAPRRVLSLKGKMEAAKMLKQDDVAAAIAKELQSIKA